MIRTASSFGVATLGVAALWGVMVAGCGKAAEVSATPPPLDAVESKFVDIEDGGSAHATRFQDGRVQVELQSTNSGRLFAAEFRKSGDMKVSVDYSLYLPGTEVDDPSRADSSSMELELDDVPSLDDAVTASLFIQKQFTNAALGLYDNWGCDLPGKWHSIASCGSKGKCCDIHDACYAKYGCSAASWLKPLSRCHLACNVPAVACFLTNPGPSKCCKLRNCGKPR